MSSARLYYFQQTKHWDVIWSELFATSSAKLEMAENRYAGFYENRAFYNGIFGFN